MILRGWAILLLVCFSAASAATGYTQQRSDQTVEGAADSLDTIDDPKDQVQEFALADQLWLEDLLRNPPYLTAARVPPGSKIGRCLLEVEGQNLISGPCVYEIRKGGSFTFHGPRQVFAGIDYSDRAFPQSISTDYFAYVIHFDDVDGIAGPSWYASWNADKSSTHADSYLGPVERKGACYSNSRTKICLWKS